MEDNNVLEKMIEMQITTFKQVAALQQALDDLQTAYRLQCVTNAHLAKTLQIVAGYVQRETYLSRDELAVLLGLPECDCKCKQGEAADELDAEVKES
jgi:hypothetical protein